MKQNLSFFGDLGIDYPILMAPMFLITNSQMVISALESGITAALPALNFRSDNALRTAVAEIRSKTKKPFGINLIVNKSNVKYKQQLKTCLELKVDFVVTSLGNPEKAINQCHNTGIKVLCEVINLQQAQKVALLGADAVIAINSEAGGHTGNMQPQQLITLLKKHLNIPIIAAGGIATSSKLNNILQMGADGACVGTAFIASNECSVSQEYKQAILDFGSSDIVLTKKITGTPLTVINTPYMRSLGTKQGTLTYLMNKSKFLKKHLRLFIAAKGIKALEKAAFGATYKNVWVAGSAIEHIHHICPVREIVKSLVKDFRHE